MRSEVEPLDGTIKPARFLSTTTLRNGFFGSGAVWHTPEQKKRSRNHQGFGDPGDRVPVPEAIRYREILNTDAREYGGSGMGNLGGVTAEAEQIRSHVQAASEAFDVLWA